MSFYCVNIENVVKYLENAKELELSFKKISIYPDSTEEIERITNPEYFKKGVNTVYFKFNKFIVLSNTFFTNINDIRPRSILFNFGQEVKEEFELVKILSKIKNCKRLQFSKICVSDQCNLSFKDTPILVKSNKFDPFFIKCKNFTCKITINKLNRQFWFTKENSKDESFIHIVESFDLELNEFQACSIEENKPFKNIFSTHLSKCNDEQELIIPMSYLNSVNINDNIESYKTAFFARELIKNICNTPKITCEMYFSKIFSNIYQFCSLLPNNCYYSFKCKNDLKSSIENSCEESYQKMVEKLTTLRISGIKSYLCDILSDEDLQLIKDVITSQNCKIYLTEVMLKVPNLNEAIEILELLSNCMSIEYVLINYKEASSSLISDPEETIRQAKCMFYKKVDLACRVIIKQIIILLKH